MYERLYSLFGKEKITKLAEANILLVGVGGVGSFCFETLIRSGILNITIVDFDEYELSNLNRQLHSNLNAIGRKKVDVLKEYAYNINPDISIQALSEFLDETTKLDFRKFDYIIDACDSYKTKIFLIDKAGDLNIKIISAMGIGNRLNPGELQVTTLDKTYNDPLARKVRSKVKNANVPVVFSKELPIKNQNHITSYICVTSYAGILLADKVIKDLINE